MSTEKLQFGPSVERPEVYPEPGKELEPRVDSHGRQVELVGEDYNRAYWTQKVEDYRHRVMKSQGYGRLDAAQAPTSAFRYTKTQLWEAEESPLVALDFIPMDPESAAFAGMEEYEWGKLTDQGRALMVANLGGVTEYPKVDSYLEMQKSPILKAVIAYNITKEELVKQARLPYNLLDRKAKWARQAIDRAFNDFLLFGGFGHQGLYNLTTDGFNLTTSVQVDWYTGGATADEIIQALVSMYDETVVRMAGASVTSAAGEAPDTIILPQNVYSYLNTQSYDSSGGAGSMSILQVAQSRLPGIVNWHWDSALNTIVDANTGRVLMYRKSPDVLAAALPTRYQEGAMIDMPHFHSQVAAFGEVSPVVVHDRRSMSYLDVDFSA